MRLLLSFLIDSSTGAIVIMGINGEIRFDYSFTVTDDNTRPRISSWLTFNASSGEFSVSDQSVAGIYNVTLTAADECR